MSKTVIITGASSGIGKAVADYFIQKGNNVVMNSSDEQRLKAAYQSLGAPSNAAYLAGDVSDPATGKQLVKLALEQFKSVDVLINNAANDQRHTTDDVDEEYWDNRMGINLKHFFFTESEQV